MANSDPTDGPPPFEDAFSGDDVEQQIYGTILQTREPVAASAIADRTDCDPKTARKYLKLVRGSRNRHPARRASSHLRTQ